MYFMEKNDYSTLIAWNLKPPQTPVIHFLPYEDHFPKAFFRRDWFLASAEKELVYESGAINRGQIRPTVWLNGQIVGRWEIKWQDSKKSASRIELVGVHVNSEIEMAAIETQRKRLENFINDKLVPLMNRK